MTYETTDIEIPHGVIFIYDPDMTIDVPGDTGAAPVQSTANCLTIWTIGEYDGTVTLVLTDEKRPLEGDVVFMGYLDTFSGKLSLMNSSCEEILTIQTDQIRPMIKVVTDGAIAAAMVYCIVESLNIPQ